MNSRIPKCLYRGDNDYENERKLKATLHFHHLSSNLTNGGIGREIANESFLKLIDKHVGIGWEKTHFLSFSEDIMTAYRFGLHCALEEVETKLYNYEEFYDYETSWDFAIITLDTERITIKELYDGVYEGYYKPLLNNPSLLYENYRIFLFDVTKIFSNLDGFIKSKENSVRDKEWLIFPATPIQLNKGIEYSGILDGGCIKEFKRYKKNNCGL